MATTHDKFQEALSHSHPGARWLAPFAVAVVLALIGLVFLLVYPHLSLSGQI